MGIGIGIGLGLNLAGRRPGAPPVTPATFTMTQLATPNRVYQRLTTTGGGQSKGAGVVSVTLNVTTGGAIRARARSAADGTTILQAPFVAVTNATAGTGPVAIPGIDARLGWFYLDLSGDGVTWTNGTTPIGMGRLVAVAGQSLMVRLLNTSPGSNPTDTTSIAAAGATVTDNGRVLATGDGSGSLTTWTKPADGTPTNSAGVSQFLTLQTAAFGVNVGVVGNAVGGTAIAQWQPGGQYFTDLATALTNAGGAIEDFIFLLGHSDAQYGATGYDAFRTGLRGFFAGVTATLSRTYRVFLSTIPNIDSTNYGSPDQRNVVRGAGADEAKAQGWTVMSIRDLQMVSDGIHQTQVGALQTAVHFHRATATTDKGPSVASAAHAPGTAIVMPVTLLAGASTLVSVGSPASRFQAFLHGDIASPLAFDATTPIVVGANQITLNLASDPGQVSVDVYPYGVAPTTDGSTDGIYDNHVDGDGIARGRQLTSPARPVTVRVAAPLTLGSAAFAPAKFGNGLNGGNGLAGINIFPASAVGFTLEWWAHVTSLAAGLGVMMGITNGFYLGQDGTGFNLSGQATVANAFPAVGEYHIAFVAHPGYATEDLYINGVLVYSGAAGLQATNLASPGSGSFGVRSFGSIGYGWNNGAIDEVALFDGARYTAPFTPPSAPYTGGEADLVHLWHLDGDGSDSVSLA